MATVVLVVHLMIAAALVGIVLMQKSEGGALGMGGSGGGGGGFLTGRGTANLLTRTTAALAAAFFITSITLTIMANKRSGWTRPHRPPPPRQHRRRATSRPKRQPRAAAASSTSCRAAARRCRAPTDCAKPRPTRSKAPRAPEPRGFWLPAPVRARSATAAVFTTALAHMQPQAIQAVSVAGCVPHGDDTSLHWRIAGQAGWYPVGGFGVWRGGAGRRDFHKVVQQFRRVDSAGHADLAADDINRRWPVNADRIIGLGGERQR